MLYSAVVDWLSKLHLSDGSEMGVDRIQRVRAWNKGWRGRQSDTVASEKR